MTASFSNNHTFLTPLEFHTHSILPVGLHQFLERFLPEGDGTAFAIRSGNFLASLPNDDELEQAHREERRAFLRDRQVKEGRAMRSATLATLLRCRWSGRVMFRGDAAATGRSLTGPGGVGMGSGGGPRGVLQGLGDLFGWGGPLPSAPPDSTYYPTVGRAGSFSSAEALGLGRDWSEVFLVVQVSTVPYCIVGGLK